jgi:opacity protein-like surface antigen
MKKNLLFIVLLLSTSMLAAAEQANANSRDSYYSSGYYLGINLGQAHADFPKSPNYQSKMDGFTGRAYIGYNVNAYMALDVGYLLLPTVRYNSPSNTIKISNSGFNFNLKIKYPIGEGFALYGQGGAAILRLSEKGAQPDIVTQNATTLTYGGGLDYVFADVGGLHTTLDYQRIAKKSGQDIDLPNYDFYSFGIYYQF